MKHLHDTEFVDFAEGTLGPERAAHLDVCGECRSQADALAGALRQAAACEIPEPSPLFWEHFSTRVRDAVAEEPAAAPSWGSSWKTPAARVILPLAAALGFFIAVFAAGTLPGLLRSSREPAAGMAIRMPPQLRGASTAAATAANRDESLAPVDDKNADVWAVLTAAASDMGVDEAHAAGLTAHPSAVDSAVQRLNPAELREFGRLLQTEMKRSSN